MKHRIIIIAKTIRDSVAITLILLLFLTIALLHDAESGHPVWLKRVIANGVIPIYIKLFIMFEIPVFVGCLVFHLRHFFGRVIRRLLNI